MSGIVARESIVETATSFDTYAASQSYFSANIVALVAAGADAIISTDSRTALSKSRNIIIKRIMAKMITGSTTWRSAMKI